MSYRNILGQRVYEVRNCRHESQDELAAALEFKSHQSIGFIEKGSRSTPLETVCAIADHYGVSVDYLLGRHKTESLNQSTQEIVEKTGLTEKALFTLEENPLVRGFINALLESSLLEDLSRSYERFVRAVDTYNSDGEIYGYIDKPVAYPLLSDEEREEKSFLREKMQETNMDVVKFTEYLLRDSFADFTNAIMERDGTNGEKGSESRRQHNKES